jgi:hypothetical protein
MDLNRLGQMALKRQDFQEAVNIFRRALEQGKSAQLFVGLGKAYYHAGDFLTARWAFYQALELEQGNRAAMEYVGRIGKVQQAAPHAERICRFRAGKDYLEIFDGSWHRFFIKGINLGLGIPGYFPGEYSILKETYLRWFDQIWQLGANAIRIYTVHPPAFYEAFARFNATGKHLYLFQGIWTELPDDSGFTGEKYDVYVKEQIRHGVSAVFGALNLPERPGYPHGRYEYDISPWTAGFIWGREWEPCAVRDYNNRMGRKLADAPGNFIAIVGGTPFERWIAGISDYLQTYAQQTFGVTHPVSVCNWPTLDPLIHPSEADQEDELAFQGIHVRRNQCNENEDMESLDVAKITSLKGGGFFATYHVYPYYPDFMNNDYLDENNAYLAYLQALKQHHGSQPLLLGEFGVPSSREVTHWQRDGWHHGGHGEAEQGEINGKLMHTAHKAGLAGGALFSWCDEWFKRNWLFFPYELPAERKPFWFNLQDAEENYGLLSAYPGYPDKLVSLAGQQEEWRGANRLYEKGSDAAMAFRFGDGGDDARQLRRMLVQHDEGFLYLRIDTAGPVDFNKAHFLVGLDTCTPETGEFALSCGTKTASPVGLKFLIHLAGEGSSRILVCKGYDKYLNRESQEIWPGVSDQGEWVMMLNRTNARRISKNRRQFFPSRVFPMSNLRYGSLARSSSRYTSLADFHLAGNMVEIRIPWGLINVTDPSSRMVLWQDRQGRTRKTDGIRMLAVSYKPVKDALYAHSTGRRSNITDSLPAKLSRDEIRAYAWEGWGTPIFHTYLKESYHIYKRTLSALTGVM